MNAEDRKEQYFNEFLDHVWYMIDYWNERPDRDDRAKLSGLAFSILVILDGDSIE